MSDRKCVLCTSGCGLVCRGIFRGDQQTAHTFVCVVLSSHTYTVLDIAFSSPLFSPPGVRTLTIQNLRDDADSVADNDIGFHHRVRTGNRRLRAATHTTSGRLLNWESAVFFVVAKRLDPISKDGISFLFCFAFRLYTCAFRITLTPSQLRCSMMSCNS